MTRLALALLALALLSTVVVVASRRRRRRAGEIRVGALPAGMRELVSHVGTISSLGMGLRLPPPGHGLARRRSLLGVR